MDPTAWSLENRVIPQIYNDVTLEIILQYLDEYEFQTEKNYKIDFTWK